MAKKATKTKEKVSKEPTLASFAMKLKPAQIRFIHLYLGGEDGSCWNNGTKAYSIAYEKDLDDKGQYATCRTEAWRLLTNPDILKYRSFLLHKAGFTEERIKERFGELSFQNANVGVALTATDRIAKIAGVIKDDGLKVNIPELTRLGEDIKSILGGKANAKQ